MNKGVIEFRKRMNAAEDKALLVDQAEGATMVLDLGAGSGKISRDIAEKWGAKVDSVDCMFKDDCLNSNLVTYYVKTIEDFLVEYAGSKKYDCIVMSAILHELSDDTLYDVVQKYLPKMMAKNCRILIREPFYDDVLGPVASKDYKTFFDLVAGGISSKKAVEYVEASKLSDSLWFNDHLFAYGDCFGLNTAIAWANLAFAVSYGEQSWEREKHELRYARSLDWCKTFFNFENKKFTGFQVNPILDKTYKEHFVNAGIPAEAFDLIQYTGMLVVIDYQTDEENK